jgi:hypothetical protein
MTEEKSESPDLRPADRDGSILLFLKNIFSDILGFIFKNKIFGIIFSLVSFVLLWVLWPYYQPHIISIRIMIPEIITVCLLLFYLSRLKRAGKTFKAVGIVFLSLLIVGGFISFGFNPHQYNTLFMQYMKLDKDTIDVLPLTKYERIHPLNSIYTASKMRIGDTLDTAKPDYVKWGSEEPRFTVGIEPAYLHQRIFGDVKSIFSLPAESSVLDFSGENQKAAHFSSGEGMYFTRDLTYLARQRMGWRSLTYTTSNAKYIPGPNGEVVQCVSLVKWEGLLFPQPTFGGVIVIDQGDPGFAGLVKRMFFGEGRLILAKDISNYEWLIGQNLVPYEVSRHVANSFRFRYGYFSPMPGYHLKDIRIPDLAGDVNDQPFTTYFSSGESGLSEKLYHYFALEPYQDNDRRNKQGLTMSVFVPADGVGSTYYYEHQEKQENLIGVSAVSTHIKEAKKNYDWSRNEVAEHRPSIHEIRGENRLFWLSTVVTKSDSENEDFLAGSAIEVFLTDAKTALPVQVDPSNPEDWAKTLSEAIK